MIRLVDVLNAWRTPEFSKILKAAIEGMDSSQLPLQQGLATTSYALDTRLKAMIISATEERDFIRARVGIFYSGIIAGCSCADDPTPVDEQNEYCVVQLDIDKRTADTRITLLRD